MKYFTLLLFLLSFIVSAQTKALEIHIDHITASDTQDGDRKFIINYHLTNTTADKISLLLKPNSISSISFGSMQNNPFYKIYENDMFMDLGAVFERPAKNPAKQKISLQWKDADKREKVRRQMRESYEISDSLIAQYERVGYLENEVLHKQRVVLNEVLSFKGYETKSYQLSLFWDRDTYFQYDEHEYQLDPNAKYYVEFTILSLQEQFKNQLSEEDFKSLMAIPNFTTGIFTSNKVVINFSQGL